MRYLKKWKAFLLPCAVTVIWVSAFLYLRPVFAQNGQSVELTVGREIYYGTYSTNYFTVDGRMAYCLEPLEDTPESGTYATQPLGDGNVRKGLYYMYGGPGYDTFRNTFGALTGESGYDKDEEYCMSHCILSYLYSGNESSFTGLNTGTIASLKQKVEKLKTLPDPPQYFSAFLFNIGGKGQTMGGVGMDKTGSIEIQKSSDHPEWSEDNSCYSLEGAEFGIYEHGGSAPLWTVTTDVDGYGKLEDIPIGSYEIGEVESPRGFAAGEKRHKITIEENTVFQYECVNTAQYHLPEFILKKTDAGTGKNQPQGAAKLAGAEFEVRYYAGYYAGDPAENGTVPRRTWVLRTNEAGEIRLMDEYKVSGDEFYKNSEGQPVFPLGTVTIREIKAPEGYLINETVFTEKITSAGQGETDTVWHVPEVPEKVIRGGLQIVKFRESDNEKEEQKTSLEGICFTITSKTTGEKTEIITDENGYASIPKNEEGRGGLVYDTYVVSEKDTPSGLKPVGDFEITILEEGRTLYYILENKKIFSPVRLVKKDSHNGEVIPIAGAEFRILDHEKKSVTMTTYYPQETVHETFQTDENGSFTLPEKLPVGKYYFQEVRAPQGYVLNDSLLEFEITKSHDWTEPFTVEFEDAPAMGRISITKTDGETTEPVAGVHFEVCAKEDILTPLGTVLVKAGTIVAELVTDEEGKAVTGDLHLGEYEVREIEPAAGYVLDEKAYEVELKYNDQNTEIVTEDMAWENQPTTVIITKTDYETDEKIEGVHFSISEKLPEGADRTGEAAGTGTEYVTDEEGRIVFRYLRPGDYCIQETESAPGYRRNDTSVEFTVDENGKINGEACMEFTITNDRTTIKDTSALWKDTGTKEIYAGEENTVTDTIILENMEEGKEYTLRGMLADAASGEALIQDGKELTVEKTWTADEPSASIEMEFPVDSASFPGKKIVVLEYLYEGDLLIASHEDLEDQGQTVYVLQRPRVSVATGDGRRTIAAAAAAIVAMTVSAVCAVAGYRRMRRRKLQKHL